MGEYEIFSLFSFSPQSKGAVVVNEISGLQSEVRSFSVEGSFKRLKTGIAGKRSETRNYSSIPRCGHNNFIVNPLGSLTSFTREVGRAQGHSPAAGGLSVIGTVWLMTFFYMDFFITWRPFSSPSMFTFSWLWGKCTFGQPVQEVQVCKTSRLIHWPVLAHNLVMGKRKGKADLGRQILELELKPTLPWRTLLWLLTFVF